MKFKITRLFIVLAILAMSSGVFAQATHTVDFEADGVGADWNWNVSENADNPPLEFVDNPDKTLPNTSDKVAKFTARQTGNNWALCFTNDDGEFTFDATNSMVKIMVHKPTISNVGFKVEGGTGAATELKVPNTVTNAWEELTFDFSALAGQTFGRLVIIPDFVEPYVTGQDRGQENIIYIDNIQVPDGVVPDPLPVPAEAAPSPTVATENVISVFSDAYTDIPNTDFNPNWGQSTVVSKVVIACDTMLLYEGLNYQGINLGCVQDVSGMVNLHIDFWSPNSTAFEVFLISQSSGEKSFVFTVANEMWVSVDIPLTHFTAQGLTISDIYQLKFVGNGSVYLDNIYFYGSTTSVNESQGAVPMVYELNQNYPNPFNPATRIGFSIPESGHVTLKVYNLVGREVEILMNEFKNAGVYEVIFDAAELPTGVYMYSISVGNYTSVRKMILAK